MQKYIHDQNVPRRGLNTSSSSLSSGYIAWGGEEEFEFEFGCEHWIAWGGGQFEFEFEFVAWGEGISSSSSSCVVMVVVVVAVLVVVVCGGGGSGSSSSSSSTSTINHWQIESVFFLSCN